MQAPNCHILLLSLVFSPDGVSTAHLMTELAVGMQARGHRVAVLTTTPHQSPEPEALARQPLRRRWGGLLYESEVGGVRVLHAKVPPKGAGVTARLLAHARFHAVCTLAGLLLAGPQDVILSPTPPLTIGLNAWLLAVLKRAPFIFNVQEIFPDIAIDMGFVRNRALKRFLFAVERFIYARASRVVVIGESFRQNLLAKGVPEARLLTIPNFVDVDEVRPGDRDNAFARANELCDSFVVLYSGNVGLTQGFETLLAAAASLRDLPDVRFVVVGNGSRRPWLEAEIARLDLPNVTLLPFQPRGVVPDIYATADVCLVPLKGGMARGTFPSKIYTIMSAGRPAIAAADADSELAWVVADARCGRRIPPDDAAALATTIRQAHADRAEWRRLGENGRSYVVARHARDVVIDRYDRLLSESRRTAAAVIP